MEREVDLFKSGFAEAKEIPSKGLCNPDTYINFTKQYNIIGSVTHPVQPRGRPITLQLRS